MGNARVTVRNLEVIEADPERNLLLLKGAVPGARNSLLLIRKSGWKKPR
jgi:large subunit ribosomal protein L3